MSTEVKDKMDKLVSGSVASFFYWAYHHASRDIENAIIHFTGTYVDFPHVSDIAFAGGIVFLFAAYIVFRRGYHAPEVQA
ncbi:hypothetical protein [Methanolobus tindarius]|uniref:hypothetical protein n=1 Tax=Methanolobus tindarius TaxID=2221 RepID=UPI0012EBFAD4|nr:hypothetical protein [Methanolobus tindarius]